MPAIAVFSSTELWHIIYGVTQPLRDCHFLGFGLPIRFPLLVNPSCTSAKLNNPRPKCSLFQATSAAGVAAGVRIRLSLANCPKSESAYAMPGKRQ